MKHRSRSLAALIAALVFVCCASGSVFAYSAIHQQLREQLMSLIKLRNGDQHFDIKSGPTCIGEVTYTLSTDQLPEVIAAGTLRTAFGPSVTTTQFEIHGLFNPLGQLSSTVGKLTSSDFIARLETHGVTPIAVRATFETGGSTREHHFDLSGPLTIHKISAGLFQIEYALPPSTKSGYLSQLLANLSTDLNLSITPSDTSRPSCAPAQIGELNIGPLLLKLTSFAGHFSQFAGGAE